MDIKPLIKKDFIVLSEDATVSELISKLGQFEKRSCLVLQNNKYVGLVEKKQLLRSRLDATEAKIKKHLQKTPLVSENTDLIEAARLLHQSNTEFLPVERNKEIIGVIEGLDVVAAASSLLQNLTVNEIKLFKSVDVQKNDPIAKVIDLMHEQKIDYVPIFDDEQLYGVVSHRDILRKYLNWSPRRDVSSKFNKMASSRGARPDMPHLASLPVSDFGTNAAVVTIAPTQGLAVAIAILVKQRLSALPVMQQDSFKGMLTLKNILGRIGELEIAPEYNLQFVGLKELRLTEHQRQVLEKTCEIEAGKLQRQITDRFTVVLHCKVYAKEAKQQKFSVHLKVEFPGGLISVSADDWDFDAALHQTFDKAETSLQHKFKNKKPERLRK